MYLVISRFGFEGRMWDLIVSVPDHCLSFYFSKIFKFQSVKFSSLKGKMSSLIRPKIELDWAFMPVLATSNFANDSIGMNELAWRRHFPIISLWEIL